METNLITIPPNYTNTNLIIGIILFVLLLTFVVIIWKKYREDPKIQVYLDCPINMCATNIYNGSKRCLDDNTSKVIYDPQFEVCSSKFFCDNPVLPYAINSDGSSNDFGICEEGTICRCSSKPSCAIDEVVLFTSNNGSVYEDDIINSTLTFSQSTFGSQGVPNSIQFRDPNNQFCKLQLNYFDRVSPGTCIFNSNTNITLNEAVRCIRSNPCISGLLAFKPNNIDDFILNNNNLGAIYSIPTGCVPGKLINGKSEDCLFSNQIPVWDSTTGKLICYDT